MILALHIQLVFIIVQQMPLNNPLFLIPFKNGIMYVVYNCIMKNLSRNSEILYLNLVDPLLTLYMKLIILLA